MIYLMIALAVSVIFCLIRKLNPCFSNRQIPDKKSDTVVEFDPEKSELLKRNNDGLISDDDFRILCCADLHLNSDECAFGLTLLERLMDKTNPDLVVLLGDNVVGRNDDVIERRLIELFERKKQYYGFVLGNHDSEMMIKERINGRNDLNREQYEAIRKEIRFVRFQTLAASKYCVGNLNAKELNGIGNYYVDIRNSKGIIKTLYFMDSGDYVYGMKKRTSLSETRCYDYLHEDQMNWFTENAKMRHNPNIVFFHIPLPEYQKAYNESLLPFVSTKKLFGNNYESVCCSGIKTKAFETFKQNKTEAILVGHDHKNDSCIDYQGVKLIYSQGLQYDGTYNRRKKAKLLKILNGLGIRCYCEGVTLLDINDNKLDIIPIYAEKEDIYQGLEPYYARAYLKGTYREK